MASEAPYPLRSPAPSRRWSRRKPTLPASPSRSRATLSSTPLISSYRPTRFDPSSRGVEISPGGGSLALSHPFRTNLAIPIASPRWCRRRQGTPVYDRASGGLATTPHPVDRRSSAHRLSRQGTPPAPVRAPRAEQRAPGPPERGVVRSTGRRRAACPRRSSMPGSSRRRGRGWV
jgi:hypothetical protein